MDDVRRKDMLFTLVHVKQSHTLQDAKVLEGEAEK